MANEFEQKLDEFVVKRNWFIHSAIVDDEDYFAVPCSEKVKDLSLELINLALDISCIIVGAEVAFYERISTGIGDKAMSPLAIAPPELATPLRSIMQITTQVIRGKSNSK